MKSKLLIMVALCAIAFTANAQTEKGKKLVGGSVILFTSNSEQGMYSQKQNEFTIGPNYGYFFSKNLVLGLNASYSYLKVMHSYDQVTAANGSYINVKITDTNKQTIHRYGPFIRYYIDLTEKFKFFGQFNASIGFGESEQTNTNPSKSKNITYAANITPSFAFFPTKKLAIELGFGLISYYNSTDKHEVANAQKVRTEAFKFGFNSLNPTLGANFHF